MFYLSDLYFTYSDEPNSGAPATCLLGLFFLLFFQSLTVLNGVDPLQTHVGEYIDFNN